jgi:hypothetical protein
VKRLLPTPGVRHQAVSIVRKLLGEELPIRDWNDRIVPAGHHQCWRLNLRKERLEFR